MSEASSIPKASATACARLLIWHELSLLTSMLNVTDADGQCGGAEREKHNHISV
jgi:hypothetical protein